ncbi:MAG: SDR family NAD(P)-dependent oxidoreductase [Acidobacteriota bacterium]
MNSSFKDKIIIITGGSSGIGAAAAKELREKGANVVITGRSEKTKAVAEETGSDHFLVDYTRLSDVRKFALELLEKYPRIDVLVNNAGGIFPDRRITPDGHEMIFQVNYLAAFLLTNLLRSRLEESHAVVINSSSAGHMFGRLDFEDLDMEKKFNPMRAYSNSKMMNILHAMEISRRFNGVSAASFHPGGVATGFARSYTGIMKFIYESPFRHLYLISPLKGAETLLWLIEGTPGRDWTPGEYYFKKKPGRKNSQVNPTTAEKLWEISERLTEKYL